MSDSFDMNHILTDLCVAIADKTTRFVASILLRRFSAGRTVMEYLEPIVRERLDSLEQAKYDGKTRASNVRIENWIKMMPFQSQKAKVIRR